MAQESERTMTVQPQSAPTPSDTARPLPGAPPSAPSVAQGSMTSAAPSAVARLLIPADEPLPAARRLVVLIPDQDTDETELARRIWALASPRGLAVLFLSLSGDPETEYRVRRRLATLAAITRDDWVSVETHLAFTSDWVRAVLTHHRPGDLVVCPAEQNVRRLGMRQPLSQALISALDAPVLALSGFFPEMPSALPGFTARLARWSILLAIVAGFFWLQVQISQLPDNWLQTALLGLSVLVEFGLIALWNHFSL